MDWFDFALSIVLTTLRGAVKNKKRKTELRAAMLKLAATINALYADDSAWAEDVRLYKSRKGIYAAKEES